MTARRRALQDAIVADYRPAAQAPGTADGSASLAVEAAGLGTWSLDFQSGEFVVSDRFKTVLGFEPGHGTWQQTSLLEVIHDDDLDRVTDDLRMHLDGLWPFDTECRMQTARGDWRSFRLTGQAQWHADGVLQVAGTVEDMTEQRRLEEELRASEARFRSVFETSPAGLVVTRSDGSLTEANEAFDALAGDRKPGQTLPLPDDCWEHLGQDGRYAAREFDMPRPDGDEVAVEVRGVDLGGDRVLHVVEDIRERRAAKAREKELRRKIVLASSRGRAIKQLPDDFVATLTHVFEAIDAGAGLAQQALNSAQGVALARDHIERLRTLVETATQELARQDAAARPERRVFQRAPLRPLLDEAARICAVRSHAPVTIQRDCQSRTPLLVDQDAIVRMLTQVLGACTARLEEAGVTDALIDLRATQEADGGALIEISDNGPEMSRGEVDQLFSPSANGHGLSAARDTAKRCGVDLSAVPSDGTWGLSVHLLVPAEPPESGLRVD